MTKKEIIEYKREILSLKQKISDLNQEINDLELENASLRTQVTQFKVNQQKYQDYKQHHQNEIEYRLDQAREEERKKYDQQISQFEALQHQIRNLDISNKQFQKQLEERNREIRIQKEQILQINKDHNLGLNILDSIKNKQETEITYQKDLNKVTEDYNKLSRDMNDVMAEHKLLKRICKVPPEFGKKLEEIKQAEKNTIEFYKRQQQIYESEINELEDERANLRHRLRNMINIFSGKSGDQRYKDLDEQQMDLVDEYVNILRQGKTQLPVTDKSKELQKKVDYLEGQLQVFKEFKDNYLTQSMSYGGGGSKGNFDELKEYIEKMLSQMQSNQPQSIEQKSHQNTQYHQQLPQSQFSASPVVLPDMMGSYEDIRQGYSYRFQSKLNVDFVDLYADSGFDQIQAKYEVAQLQLQNLENLRLLEMKEQEYQQLQYEVDEIKVQYLKLVQEQNLLYEEYYREKERFYQERQIKDKQVMAIEDRLREEETNLKVYKQFYEGVEKKEVKDKLYLEQTKRIAILDVNLIKMSRKYDGLKDEYQKIKELYDSQQLNQQKNDMVVQTKVNELTEWREKAQEQLKIMLKQLKRSVDKDEYELQRQQLQLINEKYANLELRNAEHLKNEAQQKSSEREIYMLNEQLNDIKEEFNELNIEFEMISQRLESKDDSYRRFRQIFRMLVDSIQQKNISPMLLFRQIDIDNSDSVSYNEFTQLLETLSIPLHADEKGLLFYFIDIDGSGSIQYDEFLKKLKREGLVIRKQEDEIIYALYNQIMSVGLSLKDAFQLFDKDGDNRISKKDMKDVFINMEIKFDQSMIDYVFKIADISGDGNIDYEEFEGLFNKVAKTNNEHQLQQIDWKTELMVNMKTELENNQMTLIQLFQIIDINDNNEINQSEFIELFRKMDLEITESALKELFVDIDQSMNGTISYSELINYINNKQKDYERIKRLNEIKEKNMKMSQEHSKINEEINMVDNSQKFEFRIQLMKLKEKNYQDRIDQLFGQIKSQQDTIDKQNQYLDNTQKNIMNITQEYYREKQKVNDLNNILNSKTKLENRLSELKEYEYLEEISQTRSAMNSFKNLYVIGQQQTKSLYILLEKQRVEVGQMRENIKQFQMNSDKDVLIGKLYHQIMVMKYQQADVYQNYDLQFHTIKNLQQEIVMKDDRLKEVQALLVDNQTTYLDANQQLQKEIDGLRMKIMPSISIQQIQNMGSQIKDLTQIRSELEMYNKKLREQIIQQQIDLDYFKVHKQQLLDLEVKLKKENTDHLSKQLIEYSNSLKEFKLTELRAKRQTQLLQEKEEYYQRLNRQYLGSIKELETEVANWNLKSAQREEFWIQKYNQSTKLIFSQQKQQQHQQVSHQTNESMNMSQTQNIQLQSQQQQQQIGQYDQQYVQELKNSIKMKEQRIQQLENEIENVGMQNRTQTIKRNQEEQNENSRLALAAQKTIQTLQDMLKDRNNDLEVKEERIEEIKKESRRIREQDLGVIKSKDDQIHRLQQQLNYNEKVIDDGNNQTIKNMGNQFQVDYDYVNKVDQLYKDSKRELNEVYQKMQGMVRKEKDYKKEIEVLNDRVKQLELDLKILEQNSNVLKLRKEIERYKKGLQVRDQEIGQFKESIKKIEVKYMQTIEEQQKADNKYQDIYGKFLKGNVNNSELETRLSQANQQIQNANRMTQQVRNDMEVVKSKEKEWKQKCMELELELKKWKQSGQQQVGQQVQQQVQQQKVKTNEQKIDDYFKKEDKDQIIEDLKMKVELQTIENNSLKQKHYQQFFDQNGYFKAKVMEFESAEQIRDRINQYLKENVNIDLQKMLKQSQQYPKLFFNDLEKLGIKLKEKAKYLLQNEFINMEEQIDVVKFKIFIKNQKTFGVQCQNRTVFEQQQKMQQSQKSMRVSTQQQQGQSENEKRLQKQVNLYLNVEKVQLQKQVKENEKKANDWKEKYLGLEKEYRNSMNKVNNVKMNVQQDGKNNPVVQELNQKVFQLEDQNLKLKKIIEVDKMTVIQQLTMQNTKLQKEMKKLIDSNVSRKDEGRNEFSSQKLNQEDMEKDLIIQRLKEKLDLGRNTLEVVEQKLFESQKQNFELKFIKENFDIQVDRLNRRINELVQQNKSKR